MHERRTTKSFWFALALARWALPLSRAEEHASAIIAVSAPGQTEYGNLFERWMGSWRKACAAGEVRTTLIGVGEDASGRDALRKALEAEPKEGDPLWLVLLGHGTFDGRVGKFNLRGDDVGIDEMAAWLQPFRRTVVVIAGFSASGAWLKPLSAPGRLVVTATKSGNENNFARFGGYLGDAFAKGADLDKDGETSLLEAWLSAARQTMDFYKGEGRLATEHSLLDDNGDGLGTPPDWFTGVRLTKKLQGKGVADGLRASQLHLVPSAAERALTSKQRETRDALERDLAALREKKDGMAEEEYFAALEAILLKLAQLYREGGT